MPVACVVTGGLCISVTTIYLLHCWTWIMRQHLIAQHTRNKGSSNSRYESADSPPVLTAGYSYRCPEGKMHIAMDIVSMQ